MTKMLYMSDSESNYIKRFEAEVTKAKGDYVVLDQTAFYPLGGGQPSDVGYLEWDGGKARVKEVLKKSVVKHILNGHIPKVGTRVWGELDWELRHAHMRMHTTQHIISGLVYDRYGARTVGNQLYSDHSRIDFAPLKIDQESLNELESACNELLSKNLNISIYEEDRSVLEARIDKRRANLDLLPSSVKRLRIVEVEGVDVGPCAGTHVRNTGEIGTMKIIKLQNKGKETVRITYELTYPLAV